MSDRPLPKVMPTVNRPLLTPMSPAPLLEPLTTGEVADHMNAILGVRCYSARDVRAEIAAGRLRTCRYQRRAVRLSILVAPGDMLAWAATVLRTDEHAKLRATLGLAG